MAGKYCVLHLDKQMDPFFFIFILGSTLTKRYGNTCLDARRIDHFYGADDFVDTSCMLDLILYLQEVGMK